MKRADSTKKGAKKVNKVATAGNGKWGRKGKSLEGVGVPDLDFTIACDFFIFGRAGSFFSNPVTLKSFAYRTTLRTDRDFAALCLDDVFGMGRYYLYI